MDLKELIGLHKGIRSYAKLADDCGGVLTAGRLQQMATGPLKEWPQPKSIRALSAGLRVTESAVVLAAAESLNLDVRRSAGPLEDFLPAGADRLTTDQMRAIGTLIHSIVQVRDEGGTQDAGQAEAEKTTEVRQGGASVTPLPQRQPVTADERRVAKRPSEAERARRKARDEAEGGPEGGE